MEKISGMNLEYEEWRKVLEEMGEPAYRGDQICQWIYEKRVPDFEEMSNLSKELREKLQERVRIGFPRRTKLDRSRDGTRKYLWAFEDDASVESVLMLHGGHRTACISSQVGCPLECAFCVTGSGGFQRNLSTGEITGQFLAMERQLGAPIQNIVFMGMGEPLLNRENVFRAIRCLNHPKMRSLGIRHMALSTVGIVPGILELARAELPVRLAVSLHAVDDELRSKLMPVNRVHPLEELKKSLFSYQEITGDRITIEYLLMRGINDGAEHARALVAWLRGMKVFVNLIPYNDGAGPFRSPFPEKVALFQRILEEKGVSVEVRKSRGRDIAAACGQLKREAEEQAEQAAGKSGAPSPGTPEKRAFRRTPSSGKKEEPRSGKRGSGERPSRDSGEGKETRKGFAGKGGKKSGPRGPRSSRRSSKKRGRR